jgi:hypothetical protein
VNSSTKSSLDLLEHEDELLLKLFSTLNSNRGASVQQRFTYGNAAKQIIRHLAIRQACLMDIGTVAMSSDDSLAPLGRRMMERAVERRSQFDTVGDMSRNVQGMYLNQGQDFDAHMQPLIEEVKSEINWELQESLPTIRKAARAAPLGFKRARVVLHRAPTRLSPTGPRWYERAPVVSRLLTIFDHLRDHPRATSGERMQ